MQKARQHPQSSMGSGYSNSYSAPMAAPPTVAEPGFSGDGFMNIPDGIDEELPFN